MYTLAEAKRAKKYGFKSVHCAPNAVLRREHAIAVHPGGDSFLSLSRLVKDKGVDTICRAFVDALPELPSSSHLHVIGDGPQRHELQSEFKRYSHRITFHGHLPMGEEVRRIAADCVALVCGGYVGLNAVDALAMGLAVIYPRDAQHAPEESLCNGENSRIYSTASDTQNLSWHMIDMAHNAAAWSRVRHDISQSVRRHTIESMSEGMHAAAVAQLG